MRLCTRVQQKLLTDIMHFANCVHYGQVPTCASLPIPLQFSSSWTRVTYREG